MSDRPDINDIKSFCSVLISSALLDASRVASILAEFRKRGDGPDRVGQSLMAFTAYLVAHGHLTCWQSEKLRKGMYKGFFLDHYKIMDLLGVDQERTYSRYLCEDTLAHKYVVMCINPRWVSTRKDGSHDYWVEEYQP